MSIQNINNTPSFGIRCPKEVRAKFLRTGKFYKNGKSVLKGLKNIGSDSVTLSKIKFSEHISQSFDSNDVYTRASMTFSVPMEEGIKKIYAEIWTNPGEATDLYQPFLKAVEKAEESFVRKTLNKKASKGLLEATAQELKKLFPKYNDLIERRTEVLEPTNKRAQKLAAQRAEKIQKIKNFFKNLFHFKKENK